MKILGLTYNSFPLLKGDSALLVNRKPFFVPDGVTRLIAYPALALRVCRLGKNIAPRFADRYFDAVALALDIQAANLLDELSAQGAPWTAAANLDGSFPIGTFLPVRSEDFQTCFYLNEAPLPVLQCSFSAIQEAVSRLSQATTIRQGDILYVPLSHEPIELHVEDVVTARLEGEAQDNLFCRIK